MMLYSKQRPFLEWLTQLDLEVQFRIGVTVFDICYDDQRLTKLFSMNKSVSEAAKELISEIPSRAS